MGTKQNPGKFDCYASALPDEPMFVLLARDKKAPAAIRRWASLYRLQGAFDEAKYQEAHDCADAMEAWRKGKTGLELDDIRNRVPPPVPESPWPTEDQIGVTITAALNRGSVRDAARAVLALFQRSPS